MLPALILGAKSRSKSDIQGSPSSKAVHTLHLTSNRNDTVYKDLAYKSAFSALCKIKLTVYDRQGKHSRHEKGEEEVIKQKERDRQKRMNDTGFFFQPAAELQS